MTNSMANAQIVYEMAQLGEILRLAPVVYRTPVSKIPEAITQQDLCFLVFRTRAKVVSQMPTIPVILRLFPKCKVLTSPLVDAIGPPREPLTRIYLSPQTFSEIFAT